MPIDRSDRQDVAPLADPLARQLAGIVGPSHVLADPDLITPYAVDWTRRWTGRPRLVVRPGRTDEVARVVATCAAAGAPIVAQGGNTGLVGGGVPGHGGSEVVVSLRRLDRIEPVDVDGRQLVAGAGVTLARAQAAARAHGLDVPIDFASRDTATLGGAVATNAGGERVIRHGPTRRHVAGLEAVLADGSVVRHMSGLPKDSSGFDVTSILVGSEGTLGLVTEVRLRLVPHLTERTVALVGVPGTDVAVEVLALLRRQQVDLEAAEIFHAGGMALVCDKLGLARPFKVDHPTYLLVECAGTVDPTHSLVSTLAELDGIEDAALATDGPHRDALWRYREAHAEAVAAIGIPVKLDVAVPVPVLAQFERELRALVTELAPSSRLVIWGHLAEGNLHVNLVDADEVAEPLTDSVLRLAARLGGSIGAEHGVGRAKVRWLPLTRSREELAAMRAVKRALDPAGR